MALGWIATLSIRTALSIHVARAVHPKLDMPTEFFFQPVQRRLFHLACELLFIFSIGSSAVQAITVHHGPRGYLSQDYGDRISDFRTTVYSLIVSPRLEMGRFYLGIFASLFLTSVLLLSRRRLMLLTNSRFR
jgi:hypothetical protein